MGYGVAFLTREGIMHGKESGRSAVGRGGNRWRRWQPYKWMEVSS